MEIENILPEAESEPSGAAQPEQSEAAAAPGAEAQEEETACGNQDNEAEPAQPGEGEPHAEENLNRPSFDLALFEREYSEKGALSEESYGALEKAGISKSLVDTYIEGQKALAAARASEIKNYAGGEDEYARMTAWAAENLTEAEKASFNNAVNSGDMASARLAAEGLNARYRASTGYIPAAQVEGGAGPAAGGYASMAEMVRDVQDPRYKSDEAYRKKVAEKAARSRL